MVELVAELKACVHGVVGSMGAPQDWDSAARYLSRTAKIPEEIIRGDFSAAVVPSTEVPDPPWDTLQEAKHSLCRLFVREFQRAVRDGDEAKVTRYFKLFPLIGMRDVGLDIYGRHICQAVAERGARGAGRDQKRPCSTAFLFECPHQAVSTYCAHHRNPWSFG